MTCADLVSALIIYKRVTARAVRVSSLKNLVVEIDIVTSSVEGYETGLPMICSKLGSHLLRRGILSQIAISVYTVAFY